MQQNKELETGQTGHNRRKSERTAMARSNTHSRRSSNRLRSINITRLTTTHVYTVSHLIFFSFLGTLARLGLQKLTVYPGAAVVTGVLWANLAGCFIMGMLGELRELMLPSSLSSEKENATDEEGVSNHPHQEEQIQPDISTGNQNTEARLPGSIPRKKMMMTTTPTPPIYIGLTTGLCGSMTSFSSFMRDIFLALSDDLPDPSSSTTTTHHHTSPGQNVMSTLAIIILTLSLSLSALQSGTHLGNFLQRYITTCTTNPLPRRFFPLLLPSLLDPVILLLSITSYPTILVLVLTHAPYQTHTSTLYALIFSPPACLARFYLSKRLNPVFPTFPIGTFTVNLLGTMALGAAWDLQHTRDGPVACQVLQGFQDGFCGCLTTVSTWAVEMKGLSGEKGKGKGKGTGRGKAYAYAAASVLVGLLALVAVMGGVKWSVGFRKRVC